VVPSPNCKKTTPIAAAEKAPLLLRGTHGILSPIIDWNECSEVERSASKVSGACVFRGTRVPVKALFENLEDGATVDQFLAWFPGVSRRQAEVVLDFAATSLEPQSMG